MSKNINEQKNNRIKRIRAKILSRREKPRLSVFRSNRFIYAQIIDDKKGITIVSVNEKELSQKNSNNLTKKETARNLGLLLGKKAMEKNLKEIVFDRRGYKFHGRVRELAEGAKEAGLIF